MTDSRDLPSHSPTRRLIAGRGTDEMLWQHAETIDRLACCDVSEWSDRYRRIWVLAPHPDDEILGLGGSLGRLSALQAELHVVSVTDGEASHPDSATWSALRLAETRRRELERGMAALNIHADVVRLGIPDGRVGAHREQLLKALLDRVDEHDLLLATCRFDGHPDHEACGDVAALCADLTGAAMFEYPVWLWHWAGPGEATVPWSRGRRIPVEEATVARKRAAIAAFESQIVPDGTREAILPPHVLPRFLRPFEVVFT